MDYLVSLIETHQNNIPTISKLIKYIIQNAFTDIDLMVALKLVKDIPRLKSTKKNLEDKIEILNEAKNLLENNNKRRNKY